MVTYGNTFDNDCISLITIFCHKFSRACRVVELNHQNNSTVKSLLRLKFFGVDHKKSRGAGGGGVTSHSKKKFLKRRTRINGHLVERNLPGFPAFCAISNPATLPQRWIAWKVGYINSGSPLQYSTLSSFSNANVLDTNPSFVIANCRFLELRDNETLLYCWFSVKE